MGVNKQMTNDVKVALVGAGYMAAEHAKAFSGLEGVNLVGVCSRSRALAEELASIYPGMAVCDSIADLYATTKADIVVVAVGILSMMEVAYACFDHPWSVMLEKPAGHDLSAATAILDAAKKADRLVYVALNRRSYSSTQQALAMLDMANGPRFIKVLDQQDQLSASDIHHEPPEVVRNYMYANSIHLIDYFRMFGRGDIVKVDVVEPWNPDEPGVVLAKIEFSSGDIGLYEGIWNGPGPWAVSVVAPQIRVEMRPLEHVTVQHRGDRKIHSVETNQDDVDYKPGLRQQARHAVAAVRGQPHGLATLHDAWESMQLVARIFGAV